jgi:soluble lytic murein transglycosylase
MTNDGRINLWCQRTGAKALLLFAVAAVAAAPGGATADIYRYVDGNGVLHFTNVPTDNGYRLYMREPAKTPAAAHIASRYDDVIARAARHHGLSVPLLKALIKVESDFNPRAVSRSGALGLMQIMPENLEHLQIADPFDPWDNIMGGSRYLVQLLKRFEGKIPLALAAYNAGPSLVSRYQRIPPIQETQNYVRKVLAYYHAFKGAN